VEIGACREAGVKPSRGVDCGVGCVRFLTSLMVREAEVRVAPGDEHHVMCDDHSVAPIGAWHSGVLRNLYPTRVLHKDLDQFFSIICGPEQ